MARRTEAYVDTSAFIAFLDRSDSHHALFRRLFADPPALVTSSLVVAEGHGWFLSFHCFTKYVKVTFFRGTSLRPLPPGESKHKEVRYLDIYEGDELDEKLVANWIRQASELPGWVP